MIDRTTHARRRRQLLDHLARGPDAGRPVLLSGSGDRARNLSMNPFPFRQDSSFLYFTGCDRPGAALWLDEDGATLHLPRPDVDDALWHGATPGFEALREQYGVDAVETHDRLEARVREASPLTLAVADESVNRAVSGWLGRPLAFDQHPGDDALVEAVIHLRRVKGPEEIAELREAARLTGLAHEQVIRATRPGVSERALAALFEGWLQAHGCTVGYHPILTQHGEILHNHHHDGTCEAGRLVLLDGGAELLRSGYGADVTRTWPVEGRFLPRQAAAYDAVLAAQEASLALCRPGTPYREVHDASCRVIARFLLDEGLLRDVDVETAVEIGAHALFFPHGVGHHLGLDVHDLENFGDRPSYPPNTPRPAPFGTRNLRLNLPLEANWVVTIEPGFYVVPTILGHPVLRERFEKVVDWDAARAWLGFGGIRIEDDVWITDDGHEVLSADLPKDREAIEALVGTGSDLEAMLR